MLAAPFGIPNIEVSFALLYTELVKTGKLELSRLLELLTSGPARVMNWQVPSLEAGSKADLVVLDLESSSDVQPETFKSKAKFSPWTGQSLYGWPVMTFVAGKKVFERGS